MMLREYVDKVYAVERCLRPNSHYQYQVAADAITNWSGEPVTLDDLSDELVNKWLAHLEAQSLSPATIRNRRRHLMALWRGACESGLAPNWPRKIRRLSVPWAPPRAWTHDEVQRLLDAVDKVRRTKTDAYGCRRRFWRGRRYWAAMIMVAWDTGLRGCDILALKRCQIESDGKIAVVQSKVGRLHLTRVHPATLAAVDRLKAGPEDLILPWTASEEYFRIEFRQIVRVAEIPHGTFKTLRKSSATEVELLYPGCGSTHLGHIQGQLIARVNYLDPRILIANRPMPRPLRTLSNAEGGAA